MTGVRKKATGSIQQYPDSLIPLLLPACGPETHPGQRGRSPTPDCHFFAFRSPGPTNQLVHRVFLVVSSQTLAGPVFIRS